VRFSLPPVSTGSGTHAGNSPAPLPASHALSESRQLARVSFEMPSTEIKRLYRGQ
jgi:hypothetical protein